MESNIDLLNKAIEVLSNIRDLYELREIQDLNGEVDIDIGKYFVNFKYNILGKGESENETTK